MSDTLVKVENVSKKFCRSLKRSLWYGMQDIGAELLGRSHSQNGPPPLRADEFWAVQDINFELKRGDCLGLIGRNGAGKSTLLKMLNGLLKPDTGRIEMRGRIGALIELGTGFNPILTGRENVYVNGSVLGFSKKEIDRKFEAIVEFAEIGDFIDMPVKNYSSGMKVRLGFAVAAQMDPDVLLIDEVLAVGDVGFKIKCYNAITEIVQNAGVIFVSHSMPQVARISSEVMLLEDGLSIFYGEIGEGIEKYFGYFDGPNPEIMESKECKITAIKINHFIAEIGSTIQFKHADKFELELSVSVFRPLDDVTVVVGFQDADQKAVAVHASSKNTLPEGQGSIKIEIPQLYLSNGKYSLNISLIEKSFGKQRRKYLVNFRAHCSLLVSGAHVFGHTPVLFPGTSTLNF